MIHVGDCHAWLKGLPDGAATACVTDPPYGLRFMNAKWDYNIPSVDVWREVLRVLKPGGMLLSFGGTRTYHRIAVAIEDAGFEIRDCIMWIYATGFPKSHAFAWQPTLDGTQKLKPEFIGLGFDGHGTALKPAYEPVIVAMRPLAGTYAQNALTHGVAGLNVDGCRISCEGEKLRGGMSVTLAGGWSRPWMTDKEKLQDKEKRKSEAVLKAEKEGRWPANIILDPEAGAALDAQSGITTSPSGTTNSKRIQGVAYGKYSPCSFENHNDTGGASRFFYCAKASRAEREAGLRHFEPQTVNDGRDTPIDNAYQRGETKRKNPHPTIKPLALMRYLIRLVTMPAGTVILDPYVGSGTTAVAAVQEEVDFLACELNPKYAAIAHARVAAERERMRQPCLFCRKPFCECVEAPRERENSTRTPAGEVQTILF